MTKAIVVVLLLLSLDSGARPVQGVIITGAVVDARTMQPLRGAVVIAACVPSVRPDPAGNVGFRTGPDGKFTLRGVAPGVVNFLVLKAGYASGPFSSVRPAADGERIDNVVLAIPPGASVNGRVVDEAGQPIGNAMVTVRTTGPIPDGMRPPSAVGVAYSDEDGKYWVGGLAAGDYLVSVGGLADVERLISFGTATASSSAYTVDGLALTRGPEAIPVTQAKLTLAAGEDRSSADIVVRFGDRFSGPRPLDTGTATIAGQVVDSRGTPIAHATVTLRHPARSATITRRADAGGRFEFENVPAGAVSIGVVQREAMSTVNNIARPTTLEIQPGKRTDQVTLVGTRGGTISGTLTDEYGDPIAGTVIAMAAPAAVGDITVNRGATPSDYLGILASQPGMERLFGRSVGADARGRYQLTDLPPGEYVISVVTGGATRARTEIHVRDHAGQDRVLAQSSVFFPGVTNMSQASTVVVAEGRSAVGIDLILRPVPVTNITIMVTANRPTHGIQLHRILIDDRMSIPAGMLTLTETTVSLEAAPGRYRLIAVADAVANPDGVNRLWAAADVDVDPMLPATVNLALEPGANVSGRIIFEGTNRNRQTAGASLIPISSLPGVRIASAKGNSTLTVATGEFSIDGAMPGRYVVEAGGSESSGIWVLKAATARGRDILDVPIDLLPGDNLDEVVLTLTDRVAEISGQVLDAADKPSRAGLVVVFSPDKKHWFKGSRLIRASRLDATGRYAIRPLPAGTYIAALVSESLSLEEIIEKLPSLLSSGLRVTVGEGEKKDLGFRFTFPVSRIIESSEQFTRNVKRNPRS